MRIRRARPVGSGHVSCSHINREGYPDPTASCAIKNCQKKKKRLSAKAKDRVKKTDVKDKNVYKAIEEAVVHSVELALKKDMGEYHLDVNIRLFDKGDTKAYATITFNDAVEIHGIRIYERNGQLKVSYPYEKKDETYQNLAGPATLYVKGVMETDIIDAFEKKVKEVGVQTQVPDEIPPEMLAGSPFEERSR